MEQRPTVVKDIVFTCVVLHNMLRKHQGGADRAPTPANDVAALQNEHVVYAPNENYRNPLREAKHQLELLKDYFNHVGALDGQKDRIWDVSTNNLGAEAGIYQSFLGLLSVLFRTTQLFPELLLPGIAQISNKFPKKIQSNFQNYFKPNYKSPVENNQPKLCKNVPHKSQNL